MKIKELFTQADRPPDQWRHQGRPGDAESVWQELDEYVITKELTEYLRRFLRRLPGRHRPRRNDADVTGTVGVWVSGFFGSGKSHFLKILSYLLENRKRSTRNGEQAGAPPSSSRAKIQDAMLLGDIKRAVSTASRCHPVQHRQQGRQQSGPRRHPAGLPEGLQRDAGLQRRPPHIAHLERHLDAQGQLRHLQAGFPAPSQRSTGSRNATPTTFYATNVVQALSEALARHRGVAGALVRQAQDDFNPLTVENFASWSRNTWTAKARGHRILFLVDEVGQFIGKDTH